MSKYGAVRTTVDNVTFASKREAQRYAELKLLLKAGEISDLRLQPVFVLDVFPLDVDPAPREARPIHIGKYIGDFSYWQRGDDHTLIVEDVKGVRTALYRWKKKHVEVQYGIEIREI